MTSVCRSATPRGSIRTRSGGRWTSATTRSAVHGTHRTRFAVHEDRVRLQVVGIRCGTCARTAARRAFPGLEYRPRRIAADAPPGPATRRSACSDFGAIVARFPPFVGPEVPSGTTSAPSYAVFDCDRSPRWLSRCHGPDLARDSTRRHLMRDLGRCRPIPSSPHRVSAVRPASLCVAGCRFPGSVRSDCPLSYGPTAS